MTKLRPACAARWSTYVRRFRRTRLAVMAGCLIVPAVFMGCKPQSTAGEGDKETLLRGWFEDTAEAWGVDFHHDSGHDGRYLFPESVAGGVCLLDYDSDGRLDIYFVQGGDFDTAGEEFHIGNQLFRNSGGGKFVDVSAETGVADTGYGMGCTCGDFDNDGDTDLYVTNRGANVLYRNNGDGTFTDVTFAAGLEESAWSSSAAFVDYDADGDLDLFVVNYMNWSPALERSCLALDQSRDYCAPRTYNAPAVDALYRNEGDGTFEDVTRQAGLDRANGNGLGVACGDFNRDGRVDIYVANDAMDNRLWINQGEGRFKDEALVRGCAMNGFGIAEAGMGVAALDADADGDLDLFISHLRGETNTFYRNDGEFFEDATPTTGLGTPSRFFTGFGLGFADFDHDGNLDLYVANGRVMRAEPYLDAKAPYAEPNQLFAGTGPGQFQEVKPRGGTGDLLVHASRGAAFGDLDNDGDVDIVVVNKDGPAYVLRNVVKKKGHWIILRLLNDNGANAIGAELTVTVAGSVRRAILYPSYGYCSSNDPRVHVGLGAATNVNEVIVQWPDGTKERFGPLAADRTHELRQGRGESYWR
ncbi:MAG: CRTAC1 family protein [Planctomycetes bacterium]|nr:CRTAC1 family protein [Planctomycetota bacterium]